MGRVYMGWLAVQYGINRTVYVVELHSGPTPASSCLWGRLFLEHNAAYHFWVPRSILLLYSTIVPGLQAGALQQKRSTCTRVNIVNFGFTPTVMSFTHPHNVNDEIEYGVGNK